ncbi:hypothetical protein BGZ63DRAFT_372621 [Mariannaea sp. PMI_226]|nr:hypothetical protein BGZ63DRAFT_372621 [Mariannaea sp. PMI_226]
MANILPHQVLRNLRRAVLPEGEDEAGNTPARESQDLFAGAPEDRSGEENHDDDDSGSPKNQPDKEQPQEKDDFGDAPNKSYAPSPTDIFVVRAMLVKTSNLPADIVDLIFDHAEYWAHSSNEIDYTAEHQSPMCVQATSPAQNKFILRSFPVGLRCTHHEKDLAEELAWDTVEVKPLPPPEREHDAAYFQKLASYPTTRLNNPVRKIIFSIRSHDQGWGGERGNPGTYMGAWTWFEAGLERFDADQTCDPQCTYDIRYKSESTRAPPLPLCALRPLYPDVERDPEHPDRFRYHHPLMRDEKHEIVRNRTASRNWEDRVITWRWTDHFKRDSEEAMKRDMEQGWGPETMDGEFVRSLKMGDVVTVWAKARFPGWANHIEKVKIEIFWAA